MKICPESDWDSEQRQHVEQVNIAKRRFERPFALKSFPRGHLFKFWEQRDFARAGSNGEDAPLLFAGHLHARHLAAGFHRVGLIRLAVDVMLVRLTVNVLFGRVGRGVLNPVVCLRGQDGKE